MATTTVAAIRAQLITVIEGLTPAGLNGIKFKRANREQLLQDIARGSSAHARQFAIEAPEMVDTEPYLHPDAKQLLETWDLVIAYPYSPTIAGGSGHDSLQDVIRADQSQLADAIFSPGNYLSAVNRMKVVAGVVEKSPKIWFSNMTIEVLYYASQTLT